MKTLKKITLSNCENSHVLSNQEMKDIKGGDDLKVKYTHCCSCASISGLWWGKYPSDDAAEAARIGHCGEGDKGTCSPSLILE